VTTVKVTDGGAGPGWKLVLCLLLALSAIVGLAVRGWEQEKAARAKAEAVNAQNDRQIAALGSQIAQRDAEAALYARRLADAQKAIQTPQQAVQVITRYLPAPDAAPVVVGKADLPQDVLSKLPDSPGYVIFTAKQAQDQAKRDLQCDADQNSLKACRADLIDTVGELGIEKRTAQAWETAEKGGTKWHRLVKSLKVTGCAAAGALVGAEATGGYERGGYAATGAAAGAIYCSIF